jgi:hypothetical protein
MIPSSACQPWPADQPGIMPASKATNAASYTTQPDTIATELSAS